MWIVFAKFTHVCQLFLGLAPENSLLLKAPICLTVAVYFLGQNIHTRHIFIFQSEVTNMKGKSISTRQCKVTVMTQH